MLIGGCIEVPNERKRKVRDKRNITRYFRKKKIDTESEIKNQIVKKRNVTYRRKASKGEGDTAC